MKDDKLFIRDILKIVFKHFWAIALTVTLFTAFSISLTFLLKKKYKSDFEINVYSKYFQNPLISGIIPSVFNVPEMRFTIDSMVKEAISDEFIDGLGVEYNLYSNNEDKSERDKARERQFLRDRFRYFSTGGQSYKVTFLHKDPYVAKEIAVKTLDAVKGHFIQSRIETIEMVKRMMFKRLTSFNATQNVNRKGVDKALASKSPEVLNAELSKINQSISALKKQFKDNHPKVLRLREKRRTIRSWLKEFEVTGFKIDLADTALTLNSNKEIAEKISAEFYTKYHDFNIALDIERKSVESYIGIIRKPQLPISPLWPKRRLFASLGFLIGLVFAFIYVFFKEIMTPSHEEEMVAKLENFTAVDLGILPKLSIDSQSGKKENKDTSLSDIETNT